MKPYFSGGLENEHFDLARKLVLSSSIIFRFRVCGTQLRRYATATLATLRILVIRKINISPPSSSWTSSSYGPTTPTPASPALGPKLPRMSCVEAAAATVNTGNFACPKRGCPTIWEGVLTPKKGMVDDGGGGLRRRLPKRLRIELMAIDDSESEPEPGNVYLSLDFVVTYCQNYDGLPGQWAVGSYGKVLLPMACKSYRKTAPLCNGNSIR